MSSIPTSVSWAASNDFTPSSGRVVANIDSDGPGIAGLAGGGRLGHPQVRWAGLRMPQHGGRPAQLPGDGEGIEALPLNWVECVIFRCVALQLYLSRAIP